MSGFKEWVMQIDGQPSQESFLVNDDGNIMLDYVGRTENLNEHFEDVCNHLGIEASLEKRNESDHKKYTEYYDEKVLQKVESHCQEDIKRFGYEFGEEKSREAVKKIEKKV